MYRSVHDRQGGRPADAGDDSLRPVRMTRIDLLKRYSALAETITLDQLATTELGSINPIPIHSQFVPA
jgi:hypothetical protein